MSAYTALLDANVLYPAPMRDVLVQLALADLFRAKWTVDIHREWTTALMRRQPPPDPIKLARTRDLMDRHTRDCLVTEYEPLIPALTLPDQNDRHVLAAAIVGRCDAIVTQNTKHFPEQAVSPYGIDVQHPDEFLCNQLRLSPGTFCAAIQKVRRRLVKPPYSVAEYLEILTRNGLVATAAELRPFADLL